jgi:hypothetical protein
MDRLDSPLNRFISVGHQVEHHVTDAKLFVTSQRFGNLFTGAGKMGLGKLRRSSQIESKPPSSALRAVSRISAYEGALPVSGNSARRTKSGIHD